jgi:hypothetical protein
VIDIHTEESRVRQITPLPETRKASTLGRIDYEDAFVVDVGSSHVRSAEQWFRMILEGAPLSVRAKLIPAWSMIGLKLRFVPSDESVLGWQIHASSTDFVLLGAESRIGMPGELALRCDGDKLMFATFVRQDNSLARAVWAATEPGHVRTVRSILEQASRRAS